MNYPIYDIVRVLPCTRSLHHASRNPVSFSGLAMHPVEAILYLSAALVPVAAGAHPIVFLYVSRNAVVSLSMCARAWSVI